MSGRLLTARAVSELLAVNPETVLRWTRRGELPAIRLPGGAIRFRADELEDWLEERATAQTRKCHPPRRPPPGRRLELSPTPEDEED